MAAFCPLGPEPSTSTSKSYTAPVCQAGVTAGSSVRTHRSLGHVPLAPDGDPLALDGGAPQGRDHLVHRAVRHLDQRELVRDLDRPDVTTGETGLSGDGTDEVLRPDPGAAAGAH